MKFLSCFFLAVPLCLPVLADEQAVAFGDSNCKVINPTPAAKESVLWSGACRDGYADGEGRLQWSLDGKPSALYAGSVHGGRPDGKGEMTYTDGARYKGRFKNGEREGYGSFTRKLDKTDYTGEWKHDRYEGMGMQIDADGSSYEGQFKNGKRDGDGTVVYANKDRYEGQWKDGQEEGQGVLLFYAGRRYEGQFRNGKRDGIGTMTYPSGQRFDGHWVNGQPEGSGVMHFAGGARFDGQWKQGAIEGKGVLVLSGGGRRIEGEFKDGKLMASDAVKQGDGQRFRLRQGLFDSIALFSREVASGLVPFDKAYAELSAQQKQVLKAPYGPMEETDEPPFPLHGLKTMIFKLGQAQGSLRVADRLTIIVQVSSEGDATSAQVFGGSAAMKPIAIAAVMREKYKPALCNGKPCAMNYMIVTQFEL